MEVAGESGRIWANAEALISATNLIVEEFW